MDYNTKPYVTVIQYDGVMYYGIIKIKSKQYTTLYCFSEMNEIQVESLLSLAEDWWWQSNRKIPICIFMQPQMEEYEFSTKRFNTDLVTFVNGPVLSLMDLQTKRIKRRNVALKKKK